MPQDHKAKILDCSSAYFSVSRDDEGRDIFSLESCSNWGSVDRVYIDGPDGLGSSYGREGYNRTIIGPGPISASDLSAAVASISLRCSQLCSGCGRYQEIIRLRASRERLLASINLHLH